MRKEEKRGGGKEDQEGKENQEEKKEHVVKMAELYRKQRSVGEGSEAHGLEKFRVGAGMTARMTVTGGTGEA